MNVFDESYVQDIVRACQEQRVSTLDQFRVHTTPDVNAGYQAEVAEARRRLFGSSTSLGANAPAGRHSQPTVADNDRQ
jgi:hypothetical protein